MTLEPTSSGPSRLRMVVHGVVSSTRSVMKSRYVPILFVVAVLAVVGVAAMIAVSDDDDSAGDYVKILDIVLDWPTLAFGLILMVLLLFHDEISRLIDRIKKLTLRDATVDLDPVQPDFVATEREPAAEVDQTFSPEAETGNDYMNNQIRAQYIGVLRDRNRRLQAEVQHWFERYLALYVTESTKRLLRHIAFQERSQRPASSSSLWFLAETRDPAWDAGIVPPWEALRRSLAVLIGYGLVREGEIEPGKNVPPLHVTELGHRFLAFLDSNAWHELEEELRSSQEIGGRD